MAFDPKNPGQNRSQNYPNPPVDMSAPGSAPQMPYNQGAHQSPYGAPGGQSQMPYPKGQRPMYWQPQPPMQPQPPAQPQPPMQPKKGGAAKWVLLICLLLVVGLAAVVVWNPFHEHQWQAATCGAPQTCATCGATQGTLRSHNWQAATCVSPAYCTSCGAVEGEPREHQWAEATYNEARACKVCGKSDGSPKTPGSSLNIHDIIWHAEASSVYSGDNLGDHTPEKLYDGKLNTNWTEDASGKGIGEYVILYFDDVYAVRKMHIYIGSHYSKNVYEQNCRPRTIQVTFSDGSTERIQLKDTYDEQIVVFDQYHYTDSVKLTIEEVYTGTKYQDTVIAELDFVAYRP